MAWITVCYCLGLYYDLVLFKTGIPLSLEPVSAGHTQIWNLLSLSGLQKQGQEAEENHFMHDMAQSSQVP